MSISVLTKREAIKNSRPRWKRQYSDYADDRKVEWADKTAGEIRRDLDVLDLETCGSDDIDAAIGTTGWAVIDCDECGQEKETLVRMRWQELCEDCLILALGTLLNPPAKQEEQDDDNDD